MSTPTLDLNVIKRNQVEMCIDRWYDVGDDETFLFDDANVENREALDNDYIGLWIDEDENLILKRILVKYIEKSDKVSTVSLASEVVDQVASGIEEKSGGLVKVTNLQKVEKRKISKDFATNFVSANLDLFTEVSSDTDNFIKKKVKDVLKKESEYYTSLLVITREALSPQAMTKFKSLTPICHWEVMLDERLMFNPTKHVYVPPHRLLPPKLAKKKIQELGLSNPNLTGNLKRDDPIVIYYEANLGDIIKIIRDDGYIPTPGPKTATYSYVTSAVNRGVKL